MVAVNSYTAEHIDELIADVRLAAKTFVRKTSTYAPVLSDAGKVIEMNVGVANDVVISQNADVPWDIGTVMEIVQRGAGTTTVVPGSGVTILSRGGLMSCYGQYSHIFLEKVGTDEWYLYGDLD